MEVPKDEPGRKSLCGWLRGEEARQTSIASMAQGPYAGLVVAVARRHIAALDQKRPMPPAICRSCPSSTPHQLLFQQLQFPRNATPQSYRTVLPPARK
jgi:hypothetical protein